MEIDNTKSRFFRFTPTVSAGNILTAIAVIAGAVTAWVQLNNQVGSLAVATKLTAETLATENNARKAEIKDALIQQTNDRENLYKKIESDHEETLLDIKAAQTDTKDQIKDFSSAIGQRFDRVEDKLDKKQDKK